METRLSAVGYRHLATGHREGQACVCEL